MSFFEGAAPLAVDARALQLVTHVLAGRLRSKSGGIIACLGYVVAYSYEESPATLVRSYALSVEPPTLGWPVGTP